MSRKPNVLVVNEFSQLMSGFSTYMYELLPRLHKTGKYNLFELATYVDPTNPEIQKVPWKVYPNVPHPNDKEGMERYNNGRDNQFGRFSFDEVCIDCQPDIVCTPPDTLVSTENGYVPICKINIGDMVLTHTGEYKPVTETMRRQHNGKLVKLFVNGCAKPMRLTEEHPVLIYRKREQTNQKKSNAKIYDGVYPEFVAAKDIKRGDLVVLPQRKDIGNDIGTIDITEFLDQFYIDSDKIGSFPDKSEKINRYVKLDENFGRLIGYLIGDGCVSDSQKGANIFFGGGEIEFAKDAKQLFKEIFDIDSIITKSTDKNMYTVYTNSVIIQRFLQRFIGKDTKTKFINKHLRSNKDIIRGLICGLIRSDGSYSNNTVSFCTINKGLAYSYRELCLDLGIPVNISYTAKPKAYSVCGYGSSATKLSEISQKYDFSKFKVIPSVKRIPRSTQFINNQLVAAVRNIDYDPYKGQVYNVAVKDNESYVIEYCVHNCSIRDFWMDSFINKSPLRKHFHYIHMPTVDGEPQKIEWLDEYLKCDTILTYSVWGANILEKQTQGKIQVTDVMFPGPDLKLFTPAIDKSKAKEDFGLQGDTIIIQTVMRNQPRKLYPDLFKSFNKFLEKCKAEGREDLAQKTFLYCHTTQPDVGWNIPEELRKYKLSHKVLFTYMCDKCKSFYPSFYYGEQSVCKNCQQHMCRMPSTNAGLSREQLAKVMQIADVYVQYTCSEGAAMPPNDAKACGVPCLVPLYSATAEQAGNGGALPINIDRYNQEPVHQTNQLRTFPDNDHFVEQLYKLLTDKELYNNLSREARKCVEKFYNWDEIATRWEKVIDNVPLRNNQDTWLSKPRIHTPNPNIPEGLSNEQFVNWLYVYILNTPEDIKSTEAQRLISILNNGYEPSQTPDGKPVRIPVSREKILEMMLNYLNYKNYIEQVRWNHFNPQIVSNINNGLYTEI